MQQVYVIGMGALGIMFGRQMALNMPGGGVRFIAGAQRQQRYNTEGVFCNGQPCDFVYQTPGAPAPVADLLIFAVKENGLNAAIQDAKSVVGDSTIVLSLLNGISSEETIAQAYGAEKVLYSVAQGMDATKTGNRLEYQNMGLISFGEKSGPPTPRVREVAAFFDRVGIAYECPPDMQRKLWSKFMLNCGVNQVAMVCGANYGGLQQPGRAREMMLAAMREVMCISQKAGIGLTEQDISYWMEVLARLAPAGTPSMRQDADAKRKSEVELFSGTVCGLGQKYGVETPVNAQIYARIAEIESGY